MQSSIGAMAAVLKRLSTAMKSLATHRAAAVSHPAGELHTFSPAVRSVDGTGHARVTEAGQAFEHADGAIHSTGQRHSDSGPQLVDLSSVPPVGELLRLGPGLSRELGAMSEELTHLLAGMERKFGPYHLKLDNPYYGENVETIRGKTVGIRVNSKIFDGDNVVGDTSVLFYRDHQGRLVAEHYRISLNRDAQRKGFAASFCASMDEYYRRSGVDRIEMETMRDGGAVWPRSGFEFINDNPKLLEKSVRSIEGRIEKIRDTCSSAEQQKLDAIAERFKGRDPVEYPSANELASLTGGDPPLGQRLMKGSVVYLTKAI
ncbi:hypothetical protein [Nocardia sp. NPDC051463]|uniref:hypothetical protein n=1 Tax=Nocardia sp. NPDC051463 TaxID=3154845 RepID=UPI00344B688D